MSFDDISWEAETKRLSDAFGFGDGPQFFEDDFGSMVLRDNQDFYVHWFEGVYLDVKYSPHEKSYALTSLSDALVTKNKNKQWTKITLDWNNVVVY